MKPDEVVEFLAWFDQLPEDEKKLDSIEIAARYKGYLDNRVWGVYKNTDMTEGRGREYLDRVFKTEAQAIHWQHKQSDYPNWPMHKIRMIDWDMSKLDSAEGFVIPR